VAIITVLNKEITIKSVRDEDFISLTDIARYKDADAADDLVRNWLRNRNTLEFLGLSERLNNPGSNPVEFDGIKSQASLERKRPEYTQVTPVAYAHGSPKLGQTILPVSGNWSNLSLVGHTPAANWIYSGRLRSRLA